MDTAHATSEQFAAYLDNLAEGNTSQIAGFFGPQSITWEIDREAILFFGSFRALLMQIAHPKVAQGVKDHSRFKEEPYARLVATFQAVHSMIFGDRPTAIAAAKQVHAVHMRIQGHLEDPVPGVADPTYFANDPELLIWVYATLMDTSIATHELFFQPRPRSEWDSFYQESKVFAQLFGIDPAHLPATLSDFEAWMQSTLESDTITITPTAREVANAIIYPGGLLKILSPLNYLLAVGTLPPTLGDQFGLRWMPGMRESFDFIAHSARNLAPKLPQEFRWVPAARAAYSRCAN